MKLLESEGIDAEDLQRIQQLINQGEKNQCETWMPLLLT